jgi:hypothetical protein
MARRTPEETAELVRMVEDLRASEGIGPTAAVRRVAQATGRSESSVRSAYYAARRDRGDAPPHGTQNPHIYAEMAPLVEAGVSPVQAARRLGSDKSAERVAEGFARWLAGRGDARGEEDGVLARLGDLERENRELRAALEEARRALARIADLADAAR